MKKHVIRVNRLLSSLEKLKLYCFKEKRFKTQRSNIPVMVYV